MGCMIVFVILLVIGIGILCFLTGDMTAFIALAATLVIGLGLAGILYHIYKSKQRRMEKYNPLSPTLRWMNAAGSILIGGTITNLTGKVLKQCCGIIGAFKDMRQL